MRERPDTLCKVQVNGEKVKLGIPGAAQRMEASAKLMIPLQRVGTPEDAAGAMLLLASPFASYISAQVSRPHPINVDGELIGCQDVLFKGVWPASS